MEASIGIMAYNEEQNIGNLLKSLIKQDNPQIKEIIVVNDGSTDKTKEIVKKFTQNPKIKLINIKKRKGKINAINEFIRIAKSKILILESADTIPHKKAIKYLLQELKNPNVGIVGARIVPIKNKKKNFAEFFGQFIYELHHEIALKEPKFGELIAFRKVIQKLPLNSVDEEYLAMMIKNKGYLLKYCPKAIVHNKQPSNIKDLTIQRRRIHAGHTALSQKGYYVSTYKLKNVLQALIKNLNLKRIHLIIGSVVLEVYTRILGAYDTKLNKNNHYIWEIAMSTKKPIQIEEEESKL